MQKSSLYDGKPDGYYGSNRGDLLSMVESGIKSVMDVGCGEGGTAPLLRELGANNILGIELSAAAAETACSRMDDVFIGSIEEFLERGDKEGKFDLIILGDILEHLVDPWSVLKELRNRLTDDGKFLISIPNVRHAKILMPLLFRGQWKYRRDGILDNTHLRFFTLSTAIHMIKDSGLKIVKLSNNTLRGKSRVFNAITVRLFRHFLITQYYFLCERDS